MSATHKVTKIEMLIYRCHEHSHSGNYSRILFPLHVLLPSDSIWDSSLWLLSRGLMITGIVWSLGFMLGFVNITTTLFSHINKEENQKLIFFTETHFSTSVWYIFRVFLGVRWNHRRRSYLHLICIDAGKMFLARHGKVKQETIFAGKNLH